MYDIRQFKPTLYFLLFAGITGFAMASQLAGLWVVASVGIVLNGWLVMTGRFTPMPRLVANAVTLLSLGYVAMEVRASASTPILLIGEFLVLLHLIKLFEQRANRDYAQLLILSLLLMVAAAISTASLLFGLLLIGYLFVSLYCCLLFHLKVETDNAKTLLHQPEEKINPAVLRQDQRHLTGSMRRLTGLVSSVSVMTAVLVFLFFPRGAGEGILGRRLLPADQVLSGFSDHVSFQQVARITQNQQVVAQVRVTKNGRSWGGNSQPLLLRGTTLDTYSGNGAPATQPVEGDDNRFWNRGRFRHQWIEPWQWMRSRGSPEQEVAASAGETSAFVEGAKLDDAVVQDITLQPTGTRVLFALAGAVSIRPNRDLRGRYFERDGVIETDEPLDQASPLLYTVVSNGVLPVDSEAPLGRWTKIDPRIGEYARRPDVSGTDATGRPLASLLDSGDGPPDLIEKIARSMENHLQTKFKYTLDLTDAAKLSQGQDPMVAFLYDYKMGHCEYFAGAMTLMCQSLGIPARVVVGFRSDEFNSVGQFYIVRQSHAHAWVEVLTRNGWLTFDPTSSQLATPTAGHGWFGKLKNIFNYLEYKWGTSVVAYGSENRASLVQSLNSAVTRTAVNGGQSFMNLESYFKGFKEMIESPTLIGGLIALMILSMFGLVGWFLWERARLRRRARRIGLTHLPGGEKERLARQLGFYDDLLLLLERHKIVRARHQTPLEFSDALSFLPHEVFADIRRLTDLFYRIRYGQAQISSHRRRRLANVIARLERVMADPTVIRTQ